VGWALERTLASRLVKKALEQAIAERKPQPGLVHHSDRGLQYASLDYIAILEKYQIIPSMSRPSNPYDNAGCESFMKTLKQEEIYAQEYKNLEHLRENIGDFIGQYYNRRRLHSALGYCPPEEFEEKNQRSNLATDLNVAAVILQIDGESLPGDVASSDDNRRTRMVQE
jgi:transposase InsO family protein